MRRGEGNIEAQQLSVESDGSVHVGDFADESVEALEHCGILA
jgi:hypothetical protein